MNIIQRRSPRAALMLLCGLLTPTAAQADSLQFRVPVQVKALMPAIKNVRVFCEAFDSKNAVIGGAPSIYAKPNAVGDYTGTFDINLELKYGKTSKDVSFWLCSLVLQGPEALTPTIYLYGNKPGLNSSVEAAPKPGTKPVIYADGKIP